MNKQAIYFTILIGLYLLSDSILTIIYKNRFKKNPDNVYKNPTNASHRFLGRSIVLMYLLYIFVLIDLLTNYDFGGFINNISIFNIPIIWLLGFILGILAITISIFSRLNLGGSWRVGIDKNTNDKLVQNGIYRWIRNPFFLSILGFQFSLILISPNAVTILVFFIGYMIWGFQIRSEEEFLSEKYGNEYLRYKTRTGRLFPKLF